MKTIDKVMNKTKYKCFRKVSSNSIKKEEKRVSNLQRRKIKLGVNGKCDTIEKENVDKELAMAMNDLNHANFEREITSLKSIWSKKGKAAAIFNLKERVLGAKKSGMETVAVLNPESGALVYSPNEIKDVSLKYCVKLLTNREPKSNFKEIIERNRLMHQERMKEEVNDDVSELCISEFQNALKKVSSTHRDKYQFILNSGSSMLKAIFKLFCLVWKKEEIPRMWADSELIQIYKGKGSESDLNNVRHIHIKSEVPKLVQQIVMTAASDRLFDNMTKFQIATKPGHRATEHVFCAMSQIALSESKGESIFITLFDMSKYFDRECLVDCMAELYKCSIKGKLYKLIFRLNEHTRIRVRTPVGLTDVEDTGENLGQGTLIGAVASAVNLDKGMQEQFDDEDENGESKYGEEKLYYAETKLNPFLFQDDIMNMSQSIEAAQAAIIKIENLLECKLLDFNLSKCSVLIAGERKARVRAQQQADSAPLLLCGAPMKVTAAERYLGCWLAGSAADSVAITVAKRLGPAYQALYQARAIVSDSRAGAVGGVTLMLDIIEMSIIPMLTFGCETWCPIPKKTMNDLDKFSNAALKVALGLPKTGAPLASMYIDTATYLMKNRILRQQLLFMHHLATLPDHCLAKQYYLSQKTLKLPGVVTRSQDILHELNLTNLENYSKCQIRKTVKEIMFNRNRLEILEWAKSYKKIDYDTLCNEKFERKAYLSKLNVNDARMYFRIKYFLVPTFRLDFKNNNRYKAEEWLCPDCVARVQRDRQSNLRELKRICEQDSHDQLRDKTDFSDPKQEVAFFRNVMERRNELGIQGQNLRGPKSKCTCHKLLWI